MLCKNREGDITIEENSQDRVLKLLYGNIVGRAFLNVITKPFLSKVVGNALSTKLSSKLVNSFIKTNNINMYECEERSYKSYNDFFTRTVKDGYRPINMDENVLISPADGRVSAYKINENSIFQIKNTYYTIESITRSKTVAEKYKNGYCVIVRLCVDNIHRYYYPDNGVVGKSKFIKGVLHTVNPEALNYYDIYKENSRECTLLHTDNFGTIMQIEVGALMVGKILNNHKRGTHFNKGQEKGMFEFGGSTVVLLIENNKVLLDNDLLVNTKEGYETEVKIGEKIGQRNI